MAFLLCNSFRLIVFCMLDVTKGRKVTEKINFLSQG
jgi:hypothetical protein